jgi:hypothetical protein
MWYLKRTIMKISFFNIFIVFNILILFSCAAFEFEEEYKVLNNNLSSPIHSIGLINVKCIDSNCVSQNLLEDIRMEIQHELVFKNSNSANVNIIPSYDSAINIISSKLPIDFHGFKPEVILVFKELKFKKEEQTHYMPNYMVFPNNAGVTMVGSTPYKGPLTMSCYMKFYFIDNSTGKLIYYGKSSGGAEILSIDGEISQQDYISSFSNAFSKIMENSPF